MCSVFFVVVDWSVMIRLLFACVMFNCLHKVGITFAWIS